MSFLLLGPVAGCLGFWEGRGKQEKGAPGNHPLNLLCGSLVSLSLETKPTHTLCGQWGEPAALFSLSKPERSHCRRKLSP